MLRTLSFLPLTDELKRSIADARVFLEARAVAATQPVSHDYAGPWSGAFFERLKFPNPASSKASSAYMIWPVCIAK